MLSRVTHGRTAGMTPKWTFSPDVPFSIWIKSDSDDAQADRKREYYTSQRWF